LRTDCEVEDYIDFEPSTPLKCGLDEVKKISFWRLRGIQGKLHWKFSAGNRVTLNGGILDYVGEIDMKDVVSLEKLLLGRR